MPSFFPFQEPGIISVSRPRIILSLAFGHEAILNIIKASYILAQPSDSASGRLKMKKNKNKNWVSNPSSVEGMGHLKNVSAKWLHPCAASETIY